MLAARFKTAETPAHALDLRYSSQTIASSPKLARAGANPVYKVVRTSRLYEQIVQQIEDSVLNGSLKPGDQLPAERELAQRLGVSRTAVREAVAVMERSQKDPAAYIEADLDFHLALAEAAANPLILSLIDSIVGLLREQRIKIFNVEGGPQRGQVHHKRILEAMERRDPEMARSAMRAHLEQVRQDSQVSSGSKAAGKHAPAGPRVTA